MKAEYVEINGQHYSTGYVKSHPELLRPNPPAGIRPNQSERDERRKGEAGALEESKTSVRYRVTFIVRRPRLLDTGDNDRSAIKPLRDRVTEALGLPDDREPGIAFEYQQIQSRAKSTTVLIDTLTHTTKSA
jgi:hypothetical protein